ncbi:helix-turn-helix domain-containing protein [Streptomyces sp. NPDC054933]
MTASERHRLKTMAYGHKTEYQARQRASIVLLVARGHSNARIATDTHLHVDTVRTWRGRFADGGLPALADRKRTGRGIPTPRHRHIVEDTSDGRSVAVHQGFSRPETDRPRQQAPAPAR